MKVGKYVKLKSNNNVKVGYGTVDFNNFKTLYLRLNSWVMPNSEKNNFREIINKNKRRIKIFFFNSENDFFKKETIVDLDISVNGIKTNKKSFMNLEITFFIKDSNIKFKDKRVKEFILNNSNKIIEILSEDDILFNFNLTK
jgi:hypothetical protein